MGLRIAIAGLVHETNTYVTAQTDLREFEVRRGVEIVKTFRGTSSTVDGMLSAAEELGAEIVPLVHATAAPSGPIAQSAYEELSSELVAGIKAALPVNVVALDLHGAAVAHELDDIEADLCRRIRDVLPPEVLLVAALDLHGNLTQAMADHLSLALGCHEYPHIDFFDRGVELINLSARILTEKLRPRVHVERVPLLIGAGPQTQTLDGGTPASAVNRLCTEIEARPGILDCTFFHGFAPQDVPTAGASVVAIDDGRSQSASSAAKVAAKRVWELRDAFEDHLPSPAEAVKAALDIDGGPIVVNDIGDNPGGGAPGDCTRMLEALLDANVDNACLGVMIDPTVVSAALKAGPGATIKTELGGKVSPRQGAPLSVEAYVKGLGDGQFRLRNAWRGFPIDMGIMARLQIGGIDVLVGSKPQQVLDPEVFLLNGIDVSRYKIVCVKSGVHFRAGFAAIAKAIISANGPGLSSARVNDFERLRADRPLYPLDRHASY